jgi:hypothetical protein
MARGFESKSIADQQESALERKRGGRKLSSDPETALKRRKLELARVNVVQQLEVASADAHKEILRRALEAIDRDLQNLPVTQ